jgi:hypothetical protein
MMRPLPTREEGGLPLLLLPRLLPLAEAPRLARREAREGEEEEEEEGVLEEVGAGRICLSRSGLMLLPPDLEICRGG